MGRLTIGKVAKNSDVNLETVRYYERRGLIPKPARNSSGYRQYPESAVQQIRFIKRAQDLGFTLKEIKELLSLRTDPKKSCKSVEKRATDKLADIEDKIQTLQAMKKVLKKLIRQCHSNRGSDNSCAILEALDQ